jgi:hypothetical protein
MSVAETVGLQAHEVRMMMTVALQEGRTNVCEYLITHFHYDIASTNEGQSPLMLAASR